MTKNLTHNIQQIQTLFLNPSIYTLRLVEAFLESYQTYKMEINMPPLRNIEQVFAQRVADKNEVVLEFPEKSRKILKKSFLMGFFL